MIFFWPLPPFLVKVPKFTLYFFGGRPLIGWFNNLFFRKETALKVNTMTWCFWPTRWLAWVFRFVFHKFCASNWSTSSRLLFFTFCIPDQKQETEDKTVKSSTTLFMIGKTAISWSKCPTTHFKKAYSFFNHFLVVTPGNPFCLSNC